MLLAIHKEGRKSKFRDSAIYISQMVLNGEEW